MKQRDGWVARPGKDYFVSSIEDSVNTGRPQFMLGSVFGGDNNSQSDSRGEAVSSFFPIGDKKNCAIDYYGGSVQNEYRIVDGGTNFTDFSIRNEDASTSYFQMRLEPDAWSLFDWKLSNTKHKLLRVDRDVDDRARLTIYRDDTDSDFLRLTSTKIHSSRVTGNSALSFLSSNGKYNFRNANDNANTGQIVAGNVSFRSLSREIGDENDPANFDAEGEYIGPVENLISTIDTLKQEKADLTATVNDLVARLAAIEANEVVDDATDSSLLTLVSDLATRVTALEGA